MKKLLLLLLSLLMCLSIFASCGDKEENASLSSESKNEESSQTSLEIVSDVSDEVAKDVFPKNVKYYEGDYEVKIIQGIPVPIHGITMGSKPVVDENAPSDLYYYVGFYDDLSNEDIAFLEVAGVIFVEADGNFFIKGNEPYPINEDMAEEEQLNAMRKNCQAMFENVDISQYTDEEIEYLFDCFSVTAMGYINITAHKAVAEAERGFSASLRPSENDKDRYLKIIDSYREQRTQSNLQ